MSQICNKNVLMRGSKAILRKTLNASAIAQRMGSFVTIWGINMVSLQARYFCSAIAISALFLGASSVAAQVQSADSEPDGTDYSPARTDQASLPEDIIVTANKREERLRDVPSSITVLPSETLNRLGVRDFRDYATLVPGLSQRDTYGAPGLGTVILRGMNTGEQETTNSTATYIDDAAFTANGFYAISALVTPAPDLVDVDQIEVLKGPQGTLYGASSLGGIIRILSKKADPTTFSGMAQIEGVTIASGGEGFAVRGAVNVPVIQDKLAIRASGYYRRAPGWTDNVTTGEQNVNDSRIRGGRLAIRAIPTDNLTIDLTGYYQDINVDGYATQDNVYGTTTPLFGRYKYAGVAGADTAAIRYRFVSGNVEYETAAGSIIATATYVKSTAAIVFDTSEAGSIVSLLSGFVLPLDSQVISTFGPNLKKFTAEARFASKRLGPVEFVAGAFYTSESNKYPFNMTVRTPAGAPVAEPFGSYVVTETRSDYKEYAGFANLTYYLTDQFDVTGGIRYAHNDQKGIFASGTASFAPFPGSTLEFGGDSFTYLATVRYRPSQNVSFYARAASGYRAGGAQNPAMVLPGAESFVDPDTVWNYEAGLKGSFLNGTLLADLSVYHIDWTDVRLSGINPNTGGNFQINGGAATINGFELSLIARPSQNLTIGTNAGHTRARIKSILPAAAMNTGAAKGDALPLTPDWMAAFFVDQRIPFSASTAGSLGATLRFQSDMPSNYPGAANVAVKLPSITTLDLRAGLDFASGLSLQVRADNVLNGYGYTTAQSAVGIPGFIPAQTTASVTRPRTFSLTATYKF